MSTNFRTNQSSGSVIEHDFSRPAGARRFDPRKQARTFASVLERMRLDGTCHEVEDKIRDITTIAAQTHAWGETELSAHLYTEAARALHTLGRLEDAEELLHIAFNSGDHIGETFHDITRMRASIALDRNQLTEAATQIRRADRPVLIRSATIVHNHTGGHLISTRRDDSEAGEQIRENEGFVTTATRLLEAEIMMAAGNHQAAASALAHARQNLVTSDVRKRKIDDMAMLALLVNISHDTPHAGSLDVLEELISDWKERQASAPVIARMYAAAGYAAPEYGLAINLYEYERFARLGERARRLVSNADETKDLREEHSPEQPSPEEAGTPSALNASTDQIPRSPATEAEDDESPLDLSGITNEDIEDIFKAIPDNRATEPDPLNLTPNTESQARSEPAPPAVKPIGHIGPDALDLYSVINSMESHRSTGRARFELEDAWATLHFVQGRIAHADHHSVSENPVEAFRLLWFWCDATDERISVTFTPTETVEGPLTLLNKYHSNAHLMLTAVTGDEGEEGDSADPTDKVDSAFSESRESPTSNSSLNALTSPPSEVVVALDSALESRTMQEMATRLAEHIQSFGAQNVRVQILAGENPTPIASYPQPNEENAPPRRTLVLATTASPAAIRVAVEASEPPTDNYLAAVSVLARAARFACETLPIREKAKFTTPAPEEGEGNQFVWASPAMFDVATLITQLAPMDGITLPNASVLITGETGTGKDMIARHIHDKSGRRNGQFVIVNCAAIPQDLFASTIFGYCKGAFTGAAVDTPGLLENADGGTIFFNEFAEIPTPIQAKFLTLLDHGQYSRVGEAHKIRHANVRFILATNRDARDAEIMRSDIFNRCPGKIHLKPLRERREDIPVLARHFATQYNVEVTDAALAYLKTLEWPGNIRELRSTIQMSTGMATGALTPERAREAWLRANPPAESMSDVPVDDSLLQLDDNRTLRDILEEHECRVLRAAYERSGRVIQEVINISGMAPNTIRKRLEHHGIVRTRDYGKKKASVKEGAVES